MKEEKKNKRITYSWAKGWRYRNNIQFHPYTYLDFEWPNLDDGVKALKIEL